MKMLIWKVHEEEEKKLCVQDIARKPHVCCQGVKIRTSIIIVDDDDDKNSEDFNSEDCNSDDDDDEVGRTKYCKEAP